MSTNYSRIIRLILTNASREYTDFTKNYRLVPGNRKKVDINNKKSINNQTKQQKTPGNNKKRDKKTTWRKSNLEASRKRTTLSLKL